MSERPVVETRSGTVRGEMADGAYAFRGIPYGAAVRGERRFKRALPAERWTGVRDAVAYGPAAPQAGQVIDPPTPKVPQPEPFVQDEDCLVVNVWTRGLADGGKRPVMVWLHGGGFRSGHSGAAVSNGVRLAQRGDVVVVSLNHRLSIFGHLYLEEICGPEYAGSGLAGTLDIVLALEWVRDNIAAFGGDPANVMLFGVSGGGRKICTLLAMPEAKGLFHRAIIQSGGHPRCVPAAQATRFAEGLFEFLGLARGDVGGLQAIPAAELIKQVSTFVDPKRPETQGDPEGRNWWMLSPVIDGTLLRGDPFGGIAAPESAGIPIVIGNMKHEMAMYLARMKGMGEIDRAGVANAVRPVLGARTDEMVALYERNRPGERPYDVLASIATEDRRLISIDIAEQLAARGDAPVWVYQFAWETDYLGGLMRAGHGLDVPFCFDNLEGRPTPGTRPDRFEMGALVSETWIAFAKTGDPNNPGLPQWPRYDVEKRATMILDLPPKVTDDPQSDERLAWEGIPVNLPFEGPAFVGRFGAD